MAGSSTSCSVCSSSRTNTKRSTGVWETGATAGGVTVVLGGDCALAAGTVAGARRALGAPVGLVYLDANADLSTPETSPSGYLSGMALSLALGRGPEDVVRAGGEPPAVAPD